MVLRTKEKFTLSRMYPSSSGGPRKSNSSLLQEVVQLVKSSRDDLCQEFTPVLVLDFVIQVSLNIRHREKEYCIL